MSQPDSDVVPLDDLDGVGKRVNGYGVDAVELGELVARRDTEGLNNFGGLAGLAHQLGADLKGGLNADEAKDNYARRVRAFGKNVFTEPPPASFWSLWLETFQDTTMIILTVSATVSLVLGLIPPEWLGEEKANSDWIEAIAIYVTIIIVATVTAGNNYTKDKQFRELNKAKHNFPVKVIRGGIESQILNFDVLVGDLVILDTGDQVPADGFYVSGFDLYVDESRVNGEPEAVRKTADNDPFLLSGCQITDGVGRMLVVATGMNSEWGKTLSKLQEEAEETPLQTKLDDLAVLIGKVGMAFAALVFVVLTIYWFTGDVWGQTWEWSKIRGIVQNFIIAVTIIVVAVPEGLPLAVTISLAYSMKQMMSDANLVRHLSACETMGGATNICSDKTGTLTENRMTVVQGWVAGTEFTSIPPPSFSDPVYSLLTEGIAINSKGYIHQEPGKPVEFIGNKTECALLVFGNKLGSDYTKIREAVTVEKLFAFSSARKRMSSIVVNPAGGYRMYIKGASEIILGRCTRALGPDGTVRELSSDIRASLSQRIDEMASQGLRTLTLGFRDIEKLKNWKEPPEDDLTLIGILGIMDPIRPLVPEAVRACQFAGITVRMVTGDNIKTAKKIAEDCGIYKPGGIALEGPEFASLTDDELDAKLPNLQVLARASPMDKFRLVERLKYHEEVVAVTGDGTNDAAALKKADVGLAMGIAGTEVAKEASDIIILDDNFVSIVRSCMWGRNVYDNIRKFLQFQLTVNIVALITAFVGAVTKYGTPLTAVQLLWVNLIMDTMAALALGTEKPTPELLNRKPYGRNSALISRIMYRNIVGQGVFQLVVLFVILYRGAFLWDIPSGNGSEDPTIHYTMVFNTFVFMQVFNEINSRKVGVEMNVFKGFFTNFLFVGVIAFTTVVQILVVEFGGRFTMTTHLPFNMWLWSIGLGLLCVPYGFLLRLIPVPLEPFEKPSADGISSELAFLAHRDTEKQSSSPANSPGMIKLQV